MTLSVCLIVKDEEEVLERCLNCVSKFADEIVIVDTGSTDGTVEIAKKLSANEEQELKDIVKKIKELIHSRDLLLQDTNHVDLKKVSIILKLLILLHTRLMITAKR